MSVRLEQVIRSFGRNKQQSGVFNASLCFEMQTHPRRIKIAGNMMIKFVVLVIGNFRFILSPKSRAGVYGFLPCFAQIQNNRIVDMVGICADYVAQINSVGKVFCVVFQKQLNIRAAFFFFGFFYFKTVNTVGNPFISLFFPCSFGNNFNLACHHKGRIKAYAELTD